MNPLGAAAAAASSSLRSPSFTGVTPAAFAAAAASRSPAAAAAGGSAGPSKSDKPWLQRSVALKKLQGEANTFRVKKAETDRFCRTQNILALLFWRSVDVEKVKDVYAKDAEAAEDLPKDVKVVADHLVDAVYAIAARTQPHDFSQLVSTDNELHNADLSLFLHAASIVNVTLVARQHFWPIYPDWSGDASLDPLRKKMVVKQDILTAAVLLALEAFYKTIQAKFSAGTVWSVLKTNAIASSWFPLNEPRRLDILPSNYTTVFSEWSRKKTGDIEPALKELTDKAVSVTA